MYNLVSYLLKVIQLYVRLDSEMTYYLLVSMTTIQKNSIEPS